MLPTRRHHACPFLQGHRESQLGLLRTGVLVLIACAARVPAREDRFPEQHRLERVRVAAEGAMEEGKEANEIDPL